MLAALTWRCITIDMYPILATNQFNKLNNGKVDGLYWVRRRWNAEAVYSLKTNRRASWQHVQSGLA